MAVHLAQSPLPFSAVFLSIPFIRLVQNLMALFFSATIIPQYPLYMSPSSLSTFTLSFGPFPELHCNFVLPSLHRHCLQQLCPFTELSRWSAPFLRSLPDCCGGLKVYYCAQPHSQKACSSLASSIPPVTNLCPLKL